MIGVTLFLLIFHQPFGFVAMLGTIALSGMIMRNSVILVDQIDQDKQAGHSDLEAIVDSTVRRFRPIVLTAAAAILAMIPLTQSAFFGPMAVAIMGGLTVATALTLLFLPALYAAWFGVRDLYKALVGFRNLGFENPLLSRTKFYASFSLASVIDASSFCSSVAGLTVFLSTVSDS
jgi:predicted RND superfamily exporter protein